MALDVAPSPEREAFLDEFRNDPSFVEWDNYFSDGPEHVILGRRAEGKTRLVTDWLMHPPEGVKRVLLVADEKYAAHLKRELGLRGNDDRIRSWNSKRLDAEKSDPAIEFAVDDTQMLLFSVLGVKPTLLSICVAQPYQGRQP
ncbi:hypothetical protein [Pseudoclavibacter sp. 8L]|uniref:hypothetical protein n=1 Tax=Pseudoclavibacter sp. 8L TaxID=2653162 RepID=UPI00135A0037|nr:hypothetical protein [Pseudoclavibacter sp. 8L]